MSRVSVTKWENGSSKPDGENLYLLSNCFPNLLNGFFMERTVTIKPMICV
ncbi:helix-turn-helix domain-containing protein [Escherichia coli]